MIVIDATSLTPHERDALEYIVVTMRNQAGDLATIENMRDIAYDLALDLGIHKNDSARLLEEAMTGILAKLAEGVDAR